MFTRPNRFTAPRAGTITGILAMLMIVLLGTAARAQDAYESYEPPRAEALTGGDAPAARTADVAPSTPATGVSSEVGFYLNVISSTGGRSTNTLYSSNLDTFKAEVKADRVREFLNFSPTDFFVALVGDAGHIVIACYDKATRKRTAASHCDVSNVALVSGTHRAGLNDAVVGSELQTFMRVGWAAIKFTDARRALEVQHGDVVTVDFTPTAQNSPMPSFSALNSSPFELSGTAGFRVPAAAYGGTFTREGLSFSLLAPAFSWGAQKNFSQADFRYLGFGLLLAPSIVEQPVTDQGSNGATSGSFTLKRLATGVYLDLGNYVWVGGGARFDLSEKHDHAGMFFLTLGAKAYEKLMGR